MILPLEVVGFFDFPQQRMCLQIGHEIIVIIVSRLFRSRNQNPKLPVRRGRLFMHHIAVGPIRLAIGVRSDEEGISEYARNQNRKKNARRQHHDWI